MNSHFLRLACFAIVSALPVSAAAGLIVNGSFENPVVPVGGYINYSGGSTAITGWTVVGVDSSIVNTAFTQSGVTFNAEDGNQWIDLAGVTSNSMSSGVTQSVGTTIGDAYQLTFYVGSSYALPYFFPATVDLSIDGGARTHFSNPATPPDKLDWKLFTADFTATRSTTTITFLNGDASNNYETPLDNVQLTDISPAAVPEPSSLTLFGTAFVAVAGYVGRRRSKIGSGSHA